MQRSSPVILAVTLASVLMGGSARPRPADPLAPTRAKLDALEACLGKSDSLSTSTIFPLPSSPHWAPSTTAVFARIAFRFF